MSKLGNTLLNNELVQLNHTFINRNTKIYVAGNGH